MILSVSDAFNLIRSAVPAVKTENIPLKSAGGRILCESVKADRDYPPINRATMDGIAVSASSWMQGIREWTIEATWAAGQATTNLGDTARGCAQIMTGASVPDNADGVIPFEQIDIEDNRATARSDASFEPGQNIHKKGIDCHRGKTLLTEGIKIDAPRMAIMGSVGHTQVSVAIPPQVAILSTGDEIVPTEQQIITPTQVRASNLLGLEAGLRELGVTKITAQHIADDPEITKNAIGDALASHDILILSGGVSMGKFDYVPKALKQSGVEQIFHRVSQKPGKPLWFGRTDRCVVFGLPGNPVSTLTVFRRFVAPYIQASMGQADIHPVMAKCSVAITPHPRLTTFPPVKQWYNEEGLCLVEPVIYHGSGDFASLSGSHGFVEISAGNAPTGSGSFFPFYAWRVI